MKRNKAIMCFFIFSIIIILCTLLYIQSNKNHKEKINDNDLSFIIETEDGNVTIKDGQWLDDEKYRGYTLDLEQSSCNGKTNPEGLTWDNEKQAVIFNGNIGGKCKLYFKGKGVTLMDVCPSSDSLATCVKKLGDNAQKDVGDGDLIKHTKDLESSAGDDGYRYSGNNPNNYICFGNGSEKYNMGESPQCPLTNQYRIIGAIPILGENTNLVKVIKSEYITSEELGMNTNGSLSFPETDYLSFKKVVNVPTEGFYWYPSDIPLSYYTWEDSELYKTLNNKYLDWLGSKWINDIEEAKYNIGGLISAGSPKESYNQELSNGSQSYQYSGKKITAKIGLMYVHDYWFASGQENWSDTYTNNNWLFNGISEWMISMIQPYRALYVHSSGIINGISCEPANPSLPVPGGNPCTTLKYTSNVSGFRLAVRPVFYLKEGIKIIGSSDTDGSFDIHLELNCLRTGWNLRKCTNMRHGARWNMYRCRSW